MTKEEKERIEKDARNFTEGWGENCDIKSYIAGATSENERLSAEIERLKELSEAQDEYIEVLSEASASSCVFLAAHNWFHDEKHVAKGKELREKIAEIKMKFPKR